MANTENGYEGKILRVVIENWLYNPDFTERVEAGKEVRKRLMITFPKPSWGHAPEHGA